MIINQLSPLMQAGVEGGKPRTIAGQYMSIDENGQLMYSPGEGMKPVVVQDPDKIVEISEDGMVVDNDYQVEEGEGGLVIKGMTGGGESTPGMPSEPGVGAEGMAPPMGGVGGPMEMHSPTKIYDKSGKRRKHYTY